MKFKTSILLASLVFALSVNAAHSATYAEKLYVDKQDKTLRANDTTLFNNQVVLRDMLNARDANNEWIQLQTQNKLAIPAINELNTLLQGKQNIIDAQNPLAAEYVCGLSPVAISGSYNDLVDVPEIPMLDDLTVVDTALPGQFVTAVSQDMGVITVSRAALAASDIPTISIDKVSGLQAALDARQVTLTNTDGAIIISQNGVISIAAKGIKTEMIADNAVTKEKIADGAVTGSKIADGAITKGKIGAGAVESGNIVDGAITAGKIGADAVDSTNIADNAVGTDQLATDVNLLLAGAIQAPSENTTDGTFVLTARKETIDGQVIYSYAWENIAGRTE